jgi:hypothetical protein
MSQVEVERFLGRVITDADFRTRAVLSLKSTCFSEGIVLSRQEMALLSHLDLSKFGLVAASLDDAIRRT